MKLLLITIISIWLPGPLLAQCSGAARSHAQFQWSEAARLVSPNRDWELKVEPRLTSDENESPVLLRNCRNSKSRILLTLTRTADVNWSQNGKRLLIINEPVANASTLLLFDTSSANNLPSRPTDRDTIDETVKKRLSEEIGKNRQIEFYLPEFVGWRSADLIIAVGGASTSGGAGPMTSYCYGFLIDSNTRAIKDVLTADSLHSKFRRECRVSP